MSGSFWPVRSWLVRGSEWQWRESGPTAEMWVARGPPPTSTSSLNRAQMDIVQRTTFFPIVHCPNRCPSPTTSPPLHRTRSRSAPCPATPTRRTSPCSRRGTSAAHLPCHSAKRPHKLLREAVERGLARGGRGARRGSGSRGTRARRRERTGRPSQRGRALDVRRGSRK